MYIKLIETYKVITKIVVSLNVIQLKSSQFLLQVEGRS